MTKVRVGKPKPAEELLQERIDELEAEVAYLWYELMIMGGNTSQ